MTNFSRSIRLAGIFLLLLSVLPAEGSSDFSWHDLIHLSRHEEKNNAVADSLEMARIQEERREAYGIISDIQAAPSDSNEVLITDIPWVIYGYKSRTHIVKEPVFPDPSIAMRIWRMLADSVKTVERELPDSLAERPSETLPEFLASPVPEWLRNAMRERRERENLMYDMMIASPDLIDYAYWDLPVPPVLPEEDYSFGAYIRKLNLPPIEVDGVFFEEPVLPHINWLHYFNVAIQFSQAYLSPNWYQGGTSYLAFLGNLQWKVELNQVYHPNWLFVSDFDYKLAMNSTPDDSYHKYAVSTDLLQYNLRGGYKASTHWFYTLMLQFKTPMVRSYGTNSPVRLASFLSPGELNVGLGMTYTFENEKKTLKLSTSIAPLSYNMTSCIDPEVDPLQFGIEAGRKLKNEFGSNIEVLCDWLLASNIAYKTRLFIFSDYRQFQTDWQNTLNFQFNRFLSTQLFFHLRYDTSTPEIPGRKWKKLMLKEILSVGISYTFSTR